MEKNEQIKMKLITEEELRRLLKKSNIFDAMIMYNTTALTKTTMVQAELDAEKKLMTYKNVKIKE